MPEHQLPASPTRSPPTRAVALLDYVEDLYHDWNEGGPSAGGAAKRVEAEFDRIRAELGDLPGPSRSAERLRTMLRHLTRTLHPGALNNDCFHHAETAGVANGPRT